MKPRRLLARLHLWLGLTLGALFVVTGLSGTALVFYVEIDALLHPGQHAEGQAGPAAFDTAMVTLRRTFPDKAGPWRLEVTDRPGPIPARYYDPPERAGRDFAPLLVWLSPDGAQVLRRDYWGDHAMTWLYDLHYRLLAGKTGGRVLGFAALAVLALLGLGLAAWWPRGSWAKALRFKRRAGPVRRLRDWHKLAGLVGLPALLLLTATGAMLALPRESDALLARGFGTPTRLPVVPPGAGEGAMIPPSRAAAAALAALPGARLAWIEVPGAEGKPYRLRMQVSGDPSRRFPHSFVWVDRGDARVLAVSDLRRGSATDTINAWLHPLHDGSVGGLTLRLVWLAAGLVPLALFVTGWRRWRVRR